MPVTNINRNRKHFVREILDESKGEQILGGSADGEVRVIPRYHAFYENESAKDPKAYHMTLFPTNKRVVVYQANGFLHRDKYAQLPIAEIEAITYCEIQDKKKIACVTEFVAPDESRYPSIVFKMDCSGHPDDLEQYKVILRGISKLAGIPVDDYTQDGNGIASNIYVVKDDVEPVKPAYIPHDDIEAYAEANAINREQTADAIPEMDFTFYDEEMVDVPEPAMVSQPQPQPQPQPQVQRTQAEKPNMPQQQRSQGRLKNRVKSAVPKAQQAAQQGQGIAQKPQQRPAQARTQAQQPAQQGQLTPEQQRAKQQRQQQLKQKAAQQARAAQARPQQQQPRPQQPNAGQQPQVKIQPQQGQARPQQGQARPQGQQAQPGQQQPQQQAARKAALKNALKNKPQQ